VHATIRRQKSQLHDNPSIAFFAGVARRAASHDMFRIRLFRFFPPSNPILQYRGSKYFCNFYF
jgi:hypothetical protein